MEEIENERDIPGAEATRSGKPPLGSSGRSPDDRHAIIWAILSLRVLRALCGESFFPGELLPEYYLSEARNDAAARDRALFSSPIIPALASRKSFSTGYSVLRPYPPSI